MRPSDRRNSRQLTPVRPRFSRTTAFARLCPPKGPRVRRARRLMGRYSFASVLSSPPPLIFFLRLQENQTLDETAARTVGGRGTKYQGISSHEAPKRQTRTAGSRGLPQSGLRAAAAARPGFRREGYEIFRTRGSRRRTARRRWVGRGSPDPCSRGGRGSSIGRPTRWCSHPLGPYATRSRAQRRGS